jgi:hypothetical protein
MGMSQLKKIPRHHLHEENDESFEDRVRTAVLLAGTSNWYLAKKKQGAAHSP